LPSEWRGGKESDERRGKTKRERNKRNHKLIQGKPHRALPIETFENMKVRIILEREIVRWIRFGVVGCCWEKERREKGGELWLGLEMVAGGYD
jgi:hypothetical protein